MNRFEEPSGNASRLDLRGLGDWPLASEVIGHDPVQDCPPRLLQIGDQPGLVRFYLGELYRKRGEDGDAERAVEAYQLALRESGAPARAYRSLGQSLIRIDRDEEARAALEKYLEAAPDAPDRRIIEYQIQNLR